MFWPGRNVVHRPQAPFSAGARGMALRAVTARNAWASIERVMWAVPGAVAADLIVIEPGLVLGLGEAVLHRPPGAGHGDQLGEGDRAV